MSTILILAVCEAQTYEFIQFQHAARQGGGYPKMRMIALEAFPRYISEHFWRLSAILILTFWIDYEMSEMQRDCHSRSTEP